MFFRCEREGVKNTNFRKGFWFQSWVIPWKHSWNLWKIFGSNHGSYYEWNSWKKSFWKFIWKIVFEFTEAARGKRRSRHFCVSCGTSFGYGYSLRNHITRLVKCQNDQPPMPLDLAKTCLWNVDFLTLSGRVRMIIKPNTLVTFFDMVSPWCGEMEPSTAQDWKSQNFPRKKASLRRSNGFCDRSTLLNLMLQLKSSQPESER